MLANRNSKLYFPNLNGLRFIAACFVIINHVEQLKRFYGIGFDILPQSLKNIGKLGVILFFVLSGFLITYLLIFEEKLMGKIYIRKFYIRRFLRITPLYFFLIILVFFAINNFSILEIPRLKNPILENFTTIFALHIFFLPNLATAIYGFIPYIAQAWSIGTEEQSYLIWPLLLKRFKQNRFFLMIGVILFYFLIRVLFSQNFPIEIPYKETLGKFWIHFNIDAIAVGGLFALFLIKKHKFLSYLLNIKLFYSIVFITIALLFFGITIPYFHYLTYSFLFGVIILNLAVNKKLKNVLEKPILNYLGKISYGIYMYHFLIMILTILLALKIEITSNWFIYPVTLIGSIGIAAISYHYFESFFLKLKAKFTFVKSGGSKF